MGEIIYFDLIRLSELSEIKDGTHESPKYLQKGIPFITSKNLKGGYIDFDDVNFITEEDHKFFSKRSNVEDGDILFGMIGTIGNPVLVKKDREFSIKNVALIKPNSNFVEKTYLYQVLKSPIFDKQFMTKSNKGAQPFVSLKIIKEFLVPLPSIPEQKKIAEILSTWDEAIELENQKIVFKKQYRDSFVKMMILRLEKKYKLTTTAQRINSFLIESRDRVGNNDIAPVAVGVNGIRLRTEIYNKELSSDYSNNKILRANDICFGIGTDQIVYGVLLSNNIYSVSPAYRVFNIVGIDPFYFKCYLDTKNTIYSKKYMIISARQGKSVNIKGLLNEMIIVPPRAVQQQFSKVVTEMDNEIQLLEKERNLLNTQKQGLMQRLLTGKVRVKLD